MAGIRLADEQGLVAASMGGVAKELRVGTMTLYTYVPSKEELLDLMVDQVLAAHPQVIEDWRGGKKAALGFLVGQVMKSTQGKANPALVNRLLGEKLPKV